jgi:hypothetical protein
VSNTDNRGATPRHPRSLTDRLIAAAVAASALALLLGTAADFGMAWDEGHTVRRERALSIWFAKFEAPPGHTRAEMFGEHELDRYWRFSREEPDGHPPFYALLGLAGWVLAGPFLNPLTAYRFGPLVLTAVTAGVLYHHLAARRGRLAGFTAAGLLLLTPRTLAHAHYAHYDMPMTCLWLLAQVAFVKGLDSARWAAAFGIALGLAAGTKFTGFFAAVASICWVAWSEGPAVAHRLFSGGGDERTRPLRGLRTLLIGLPVAALTLYAIQPPWWSDPARGLWRYVVSNTTRGQSLPIPTLYLGRVYGFSLPWHNTTVLTAVTVPVVVLALGLLGLVSCWARRKADPWCLIWPLSWATLMVVRALPGAPGHDGIRLFLPSIASLAVLAGLGAAWLRDLGRSRRLGWVAPAVVVLAFGESLAGIARTYPYTDSYYSAAVGGLPGAERLGFELTYYWETLGPEYLNWVAAESRRRPIELRFPTPVVTTVLLREWGMLPRRSKIDPIDPVAAPDYLLQRRRGVYLPHDWWLERHGRPLFVVRRQGVDLMRVYPDSEFQRAALATRDVPVPDYIMNHFRGGHLHYRGSQPSPTAQPQNHDGPTPSGR